MNCFLCGKEMSQRVTPVCSARCLRRGEKIGCEFEAVPDQIRAWAMREFDGSCAEQVAQDLLKVATGIREGNALEEALLEKIFGSTVIPEGIVGDADPPHFVG